MHASLSAFRGENIGINLSLLVSHYDLEFFLAISHGHKELRGCEN